MHQVSQKSWIRLELRVENPYAEHNTITHGQLFQPYPMDSTISNGQGQTR